MENRPTKHRRFGREIHRSISDVHANHTSKKESLDNFLIKTGIQPFVFVGQCAKYFGLLTVAAFLLGAGGVYGYALLIRPLPYAKAPVQDSSTSIAPLKKVWLHGKVKDNARPRAEDFEIGVVATRKGPFQDGSYEIQVPESDAYSFALWDAGYQHFKYVELKADSAGNLNDVNFPADLAKVELPANKQGRGVRDIYAEVGDKPVRERTQLALTDGKRNGK
jgi:hypothetical protein